MANYTYPALGVSGGGGGTVTGTGAAGQVAVWSALSAIGGSSDLTFTGGVLTVNGQAKLPNGGFGSPSYSFTNAPDTGLRLQDAVGGVVSIDSLGSTAAQFFYDGAESVWVFNGEWRLRNTSGTEFFDLASGIFNIGPNVSLTHLSHDLQVDGDVTTNGTNNFNGEQTFTSGEVHVNAISAPSSPPTVALAGLGAGDLENGDHRWLYVFHTQNDQTTSVGAFSSTLTVVDNTTNGQAAISAIPVSLNSSVVLTDAYQSYNGGDYYYDSSASVVNGQTLATASKSYADCVIGGVLAPIVNTTGALVVDGDLNVINAGFQANSNGIALSTQIRSTGTKNGFFGATPVVQQTGGVATAGAVYTATEQGMIQTMWDALRAYGWLS